MSFDLRASPPTTPPPSDRGSTPWVPPSALRRSAAARRIFAGPACGVSPNPSSLPLPTLLLVA